MTAKKRALPSMAGDDVRASMHTAFAAAFIEEVERRAGTSRESMLTCTETIMNSWLPVAPGGKEYQHIVNVVSLLRRILGVEQEEEREHPDNCLCDKHAPEAKRFFRETPSPAANEKKARELLKDIYYYPSEFDRLQRICCNNCGQDCDCEISKGLTVEEYKDKTICPRCGCRFSGRPAKDSI